MKNQALFSSKGKSKILKCRQLQFLFDALRIKIIKIGTTKLFIVSVIEMEQCGFTIE